LSTPRTPAGSYPLSLHDALPILLLAARQVAGQPGAFLQAREIVEHALDVGRDLAVAPRERAQAQVLDHGHVGNDAPPLHDLEDRSEEHTSELQSRGHLVCRLLLE